MSLRRWVTFLAALGLFAGACNAGNGADNSSDRPCAAQPAFGDTTPRLADGGSHAEVWSTTYDEATFSSPRAVDLTGDGVLDIVQGFGQDTFGARESSVIATNGATGEQVWRSSGHDDLIGSATFVSLSGDDTADVVIGGRRGALVALDGATGSVLWKFDDRGDNWFNFYTSQAIPDQDADGIADLFAVNGGLMINQPEEGGGVLDPDERHLGTVMVISGADGSVIASVPVPDRGESYMSPVLLGASGGTVDVLIGTGGETLPGSIWKVSIADVLARDLSAAEQLVSGGAKGMIASPVLADMTGDCIDDIVVQAFDGTVTLVNGATGDQLWSVTNSGFETYSTPALGYFTGSDDVPDVFTSVARGVWPEYEASDYLLIDGATGDVVWREQLGTFAPSGFVAADLNGDGRDEVIFGANDPLANAQQMYVLDASHKALHLLGGPLGQTTFSAPWLGDVDRDGQLDLMVTSSSYQPPTAPAVVTRLELQWRVPTSVSWGGYLGTGGTSRLNNTVYPDY